MSHGRTIMLCNIVIIYNIWTLSLHSFYPRWEQQSSMMTAFWMRPFYRALFLCQSSYLHPPGFPFRISMLSTRPLLPGPLRRYAPSLWCQNAGIFSAGYYKVVKLERCYQPFGRPEWESLEKCANIFLINILMSSLVCTKDPF